jgi:quercetin dioxygenase-like cupin family protein
MKNSPVSDAIEAMSPAIEYDITRRLFLAGMAGAMYAFSTKPLIAQITTSNNTSISSDGIIRTTLQSYENAEGEDFRLVLTTYPPGIGLPSHHHPSVAFNYILEGIAESQYSDEQLQKFTSGDSFQDKANIQHTIFRNPDQSKPLKYLIVYTVKKGEPFLIIP